MKAVCLISIAFLCISEVLANENDFEPRMNSYSVKRASDIDIVSKDKADEILSKRLFREEFKKHVLDTLAIFVQRDPVLRKCGNPDIKIFYQVLSDGNCHFEYKTHSGSDKSELKVISRLADVLKDCSFCHIPESQGIGFGGQVSLQELLEFKGDHKLLSKDFFVRTMELKSPKQDPKIIQPIEHVPLF